MSFHDRARRLPAVVALALVFLATAALADSGAPTPTVIDALKAEPPLPDIVEGSAEAPATIIEYASMTCAHCAAFSIAAFMLARCAGPEKRDAVIDRLFNQQEEWAFAEKALLKLKAEVVAAGMTAEGFDACLKNYDLLNNVKKMRDIAVDKLAVQGTPTFFVNGRRIDGEEGLHSFDQILTPVMR
jgi:protein-disulfide isomerase